MDNKNFTQTNKKNKKSRALEDKDFQKFLSKNSARNFVSIDDLKDKFRAVTLGKGRDSKFSRTHPIERSITPVFDEHMFSLLGLGSTAKSVEEAADGISSFVESVDPVGIQEAIGSFCDVANKFNDFLTPEKVEQAKDVFQAVAGMHESFTSGLKKAKFGFFCFTALAALGCTVASIRKRSLKWATAAAIFMAVAYFSSPVNIRTEILSFVFNVLPEFTKIKEETENVDSDTPVFTEHFGVDTLKKAIGAFVLVILAVQGFKKTEVNISSIVSFILKTAKLDTLTDIITWILELLEIAANSVSQALGYDKVFRFIKTEIKAIDDLLSKVDLVERKISLKSFSFTQSNFEYVCRLNDEALRLLKTVPSRDCIAALQTLNYIIRILRDIKKSFNETSFAIRGLRPEPVGILLKSPPGMGKSNLVHELHTSVCARTLPEDMLESFYDDPEKFMFDRKNENEYWEGYDDDKWVCVFDDLGQVRDVAGGGATEWLELIRAINSFSYHLHMASIEKKANTLFRSRFVIATTNLDELKSESIMSIDAVNRRFDFVITVDVKPEFSKVIERGTKRVKIIDSDALPLDERGAPIFDHNMNLFVLHCVDGDKSISYNSMIDLFVAKFHMKEAWHLQKCETLNNLAREEYGKRDKPFVEHVLLDGDDPLPMRSLRDMTVGEFVGKDACGEDVRYKVPSDGFVNKLRRFNMESRLYWAINTKTGDEEVDAFIEAVDEYLLQCSNKDFFDTYRKLNFVQSELEMALGPEYRPFINKGTAIAFMYHAELGNLEEFLACDYRQFLDIVQDGIYGVPLTKVAAFGPIFRAATKLYTVKTIFTEWVPAFCKRYWDDPKLLIFDLIDYIKRVRVQYGVVFDIMWLFVGWLGLTNLWSRMMNYFVASNCEQGANLRYALTSKKLGASGALDQYEKEILDAIRLRRQALGTNDVNTLLQGQGATVMEQHMAPSFDVNSDQVINKIIKHNTYEFRIEILGVSSLCGFATFLKGTCAIIPLHFATRIASRCEKDVTYKNNKIILVKTTPNKRGEMLKFTFSVEQFLQGIILDDSSEVRDLCLFKAPRNVVHPHPNIVRFFASQAHYETVVNYPSRIIYPSSEGLNIDHYVKALPISQPVIIDGVFGRRPLVKGFRYEGPFKTGDCGALLCVMTRRSTLGTVFGIHVSGHSDGVGVANSTPREYLELLLTAASKEDLVDVPFDPKDDLFTVKEVIDEHCGGVELPARFITQCCLDTPVSSGSETHIKPSRLCGLWGAPLKKPAKMRPFKKEGVLVDPFVRAINRYCNNGTVFIDSDRAHKAMLAYFDFCHYNSNKFVEKRLLTFEEAVAGLEDDVDFGSMNRKSSAGFPFSTLPLFKGKGKTAIFGQEGPFIFTTEPCVIVRARVCDIIEKAKEGVRLLHVYTDFLKDELRAISKVECGDTRFVSGCPVDLSIATRIYFGSFVLWYTKNRISNGSAIGMNVYSNEWGWVADWLRELGGDDTLYGAGDQHSYDAKEVPAISWKVLDMINLWYDDGEEAADVRRILWLEVINSIHVRHDVVYSWNGSLPSGHILTSVINTIYNHIVTRLCWGDLFGHDMRSYVSFSQNVRFLVYGDDSIFSVKADFRERFNEATLAVCYANYGLVYTSDTKDGTNVALRKFEDISFLKRKFRFDGGSKGLLKYVAPLDLNTVRQSPYFTTTDALMELTVTKERVQNSLDELSLHGEGTFKEYAPVIISSVKEFYDWVPMRTSYLVCRDFAVSRDSYLDCFL